MIAMAPARIASTEPATLRQSLTRNGSTHRSQFEEAWMSASLLGQGARYALAGLMVLGSSVALAAAQNVKIGAIMSTPRAAAGVGGAGLRSIQLAIHLVNEAGGPVDDQVELVAADDAANPHVRGSTPPSASSTSN
jgi:ABC-type branched-subunit amino acid transport system substrate-binding protein